jgi:hypothetical protein
LPTCRAPAPSAAIRGAISEDIRGSISGAIRSHQRGHLGLRR